MASGARKRLISSPSWCAQRRCSEPSHLLPLKDAQTRLLLKLMCNLRIDLAPAPSSKNSGCMVLDRRIDQQTANHLLGVSGDLGLFNGS